MRWTTCAPRELCAGRALLLLWQLTLSRTTFRVTRVKPKNDTEKRVYEALSGDNWGASSTTLNEIAQDTFD